MKLMKKITKIMRNNRGMGTVEMILIIVVLIGLVLIFKTQISDLVGNVCTVMRIFMGEIYTITT